MATPKGWHYFATNLDRAGGETLAINDLELSGVQLSSTLSGPGGLNATIPLKEKRIVGSDGSPMLKPWQSAVYAELDGVIRGGGIITGDLDLDDGPAALSCQGFSAYPTGDPYEGADKNYVQADPFDIARAFWKDLQARARSNIGLSVVCSPSSTPIRLGRLPVEKWTTIDLDKLEKAHAKAPLLPAGTPFIYTYTDYDSSGHARKVKRYGLASRTSYYAGDAFPQMWWDTGAFTTNRGKLLIWDNGSIEEQYVYDKAHAVFPSGLVDGVIKDAKGNITWAIFGYVTTTVPKADTDGTELKPYPLNAWDTLDMGDWWNNLYKDGGFDSYETMAWADGHTPDRESMQVGDPVDIDHTLHLGYPTVGVDLRDSPHHRFEIGENVFTVPTLSLSASDYCDRVLVVGAGQGRSAVRGHATVPDQGRLHRTKVTSDASIKTTALAMKRAAQIASSYAGEQNISELKVRNHSYAPLGSYSEGDTIQVVGSGRGWVANVDLTLRIKDIAMNPDEGDTAILSVARPDKFGAEV